MDIVKNASRVITKRIEIEYAIQASRKEKMKYGTYSLWNIQDNFLNLNIKTDGNKEEKS